MRRRGKVDRNQPLIVRELEQAGVTVMRMSDLGDGKPDICAGQGGRNWLFEIKDPLAKPSERRLTEREKDFHDSWRGQVHVIYNSEDALMIMGLL